MKIISITYKDLQIFFRDGGSLVWLFVVPLVFIIVLTGIFSASVAVEEEDVRIPLPLVNQDTSGNNAAELILLLNETGGLEVEEYGYDEAQSLLDAEEIKFLLIIPQDFSQQIEAQQLTTLTMISLNPADSDTSAAIFILEGVTRGLSLEMQIIASLEQIGEMQSGLPEGDQLFTAERNVQQAEKQFQDSKDNPLISVVQKLPEILEAREEIINIVQITVPGLTVLFAFLAALTTARSIYDEKKFGSFRRLQAAPLRKLELFIGKLLPNFLIVLIQVIVIFGASMLILPLLGMDRLTLGDAPIGLLLATLTLAVCSTSLGILVAGLARSEGQISGLGTMLLFIFAFLGGCIVPLTFFNSQVVNTISQFTPHFYAVSAYRDIMVRGYGLEAIWLDLVILLVISLVFFAIGTWRFKFE
jgi:ABC-2 type transport system permease protein